MKLKIEINMDNDAMLKDPMGEVVRMIKLAVRQTELQKSCNLHDINGQIVGTLEVIPDRKYNPSDFSKGDILNITTIVLDKKQTIKNAKVIGVSDNELRLDTTDHFWYIEYENIINFKKL